MSEKKNHIHRMCDRDSVLQLKVMERFGTEQPEENVHFEIMMNTVSKSPKTLQKHENVFQIEWKDGHASWYPYRYLRQMCPCAECAIIRHKGKDIHSLFSPQGDGDVTLIEVSEDIQPTDIQLVGRYALQFSWTDGHNAGIYPFDVLRETCPCPECVPIQRNENEDAT